MRGKAGKVTSGEGAIRIRKVFIKGKKGFAVRLPPHPRGQKEGHTANLGHHPLPHPGHSHRDSYSHKPVVRSPFRQEWVSFQSIPIRWWFYKNRCTREIWRTCLRANGLCFHERFEWGESLPCGPVASLVCTQPCGQSTQSPTWQDSVPCPVHPFLPFHPHVCGCWLSLKNNIPKWCSERPWTLKREDFSCFTVSILWGIWDLGLQSWEVYGTSPLDGKNSPLLLQDRDQAHIPWPTPGRGVGGWLAGGKQVPGRG